MVLFLTVFAKSVPNLIFVYTNKKWFTKLQKQLAGAVNNSIKQTPA